MDIDNMCSKLRERAKCSENGAVVAEEDVEDILERARLKSGTGVAASIKAGDWQDLLSNIDQGKRKGDSLDLRRQYWSCGVLTLRTRISSTLHLDFHHLMIPLSTFAFAVATTSPTLLPIGISGTNTSSTCMSSELAIKEARSSFVQTTFGNT